MLRPRFHHLNLFFIFWLAMAEFSKAQVVTISPRFPKITDSITVIFDATKGNGGLKDSTEIYIHSGVVTQGPNSTAWSNVPMAWGSADPRWRMTNLGNNKFQIRYRPTTFYNISPTTTVHRLGFVFRNRSGSVTGKTSENGDIFMPIFQPSQQAIAFFGLEYRFVLADFNQSIPYLGASNFVTNLQVFVNGVLSNSASNDTVISGSLPTNTGGTKKIVLRSQSNLALKDSFTLRVNQPTQIAALPPGIEDGINILSPTSVVLCLRAPGKNVVYAIGEFNNWELTDENQMKRSPDGKFWWLQLDNLDPARTYAYQYFVDGTLRIADPYSNIILDPSNDGFISSTTFPNLKPYPTGKTTGNVSVFRTVEPQFNWQHTNFKRPEPKDLVVYELLIRDFANTKTFKMLADTLPYLKKLGINCVKIMPIMEFEGNLSWGYNPSHHYALDKFYGTQTALKEFVDKAHGMCMAVVLDIALNHAFGQSPMVQLYWNAALNRPAANSPWFNEVPKHDFNVGFDFNHESEDTKYYVDRVIKQWLQEYRVDGFRWDLSKGFTQRNSLGNVGFWGSYDAARVQTWKNIYNRMQILSPCSYCILEHFADNSEETELANYGLMFWGNANNAYTEAVMGWNNTSDLGYSYYRNRGWQKPHLISYMESHDEERMMYKSLQYGNNSQAAAGYNLRDTTTILDRIKLASTFFYALPGPKMIWQFGELGYGYSINWPCTNPCTNGTNRTAQKPIRWDYLNEPRRRSLWNTTRALIALHRFEPVFSTAPTGSNLFIGNVAMKRINLTHASRNVVVLGNFGVVAGSINPNFPAAGKWYDFFTGDSIEVANPTAPLSLNRGEYRMYSNIKWPSPAYYQDLLANVTCNNPPGTDPCGNVLAVEAPHTGSWESVRLYPNPTSGQTWVELPWLSDGQAKIQLVDLQGRIIGLPDAEVLGGGFSFDPQGAAVKPGLYHLRILFRGKSYVARVLIQESR